VSTAQFSSNSIVTETVVAFLKSVPPFQFLPSFELSALAKCMALEYFPKDTLILGSGQAASDALYIVQKGGVKLALRTQVGKELTLDMRSEGEFFGLLSVLGRNLARLDVTALEDTICYSIPAAKMQGLIARHAEVADYLFRISIERYVDRSLNELRTQSGLMGDTERVLYSLSARDVVKTQPLLASENTTIREAAQIMSSSNAPCLFVLGENGCARGIVTDRDFANKVVARALPLDVPVTQIMSTPVIGVEGSERLFHVLLAMLSHDIHHVLVTEEKIPKGVLTGHDLMLLQGKSPLNLARHVEQQQTLEGLAEAQKRIRDLLPLLLREGAKASHITRVVAEINDRVLCKVLQFAHAKLGPAPVPYCWVVLGSEGRREQTFKTDQDNALIYADAEDSAAAKEYFALLAAFVNDSLEACGYPPCPGNFMARNPRWQQPLNIWRNYFHEWISGADRHATEDALILFDMRPVGGDFSLFKNLSAHNRELLKDGGFFKSVLAYISTEQTPPLGFFRTFVVERSGEHKEELDLKLVGAGPIVNAARLFALDAAVEHTNTVDRLQALQSLAYKDPTLLKDLQEGFEFLTILRIQCQLQQASTGQPISNYVAPDKLTSLQRSLLKEVFQTVARVQSLISKEFRTAVWSELGR
jgi:CBS domain-containing protein